MNTQDRLRDWIIRQLATRNRGTRARLAKFLNLSPSQLSNMLNMEAGKETRNIQADEWLKILAFFEIKGDNLNLPQMSNENPERAEFIRTYDNAGAEQQADLSAMIRIYSSAKPKQRDVIINIIRTLAKTYDIPH